MIKKSYVTITGSVGEAAVLNQLVYWSERVKDAAAAKAEDESSQNDYTVENLPSFGWIYKTAKELSNEIMLGSARTVARRLESLVIKGFILRRHNPNFRFDHTYQYRVNTKLIEKKLAETGASKRQNDNSIKKTFKVQSQAVPLKAETDKLNSHIVNARGQAVNESCHSDGLASQTDRTIPEITSNTTSYITSNQNRPVPYNNAFSQQVAQRPYAQKQNRYYGTAKKESKPSFDIDEFVRFSMMQIYADDD